MGEAAAGERRECGGKGGGRHGVVLYCVVVYFAQLLGIGTGYYCRNGWLGIASPHVRIEL